MGTEESNDGERRIMHSHKNAWKEEARKPSSHGLRLHFYFYDMTESSERTTNGVKCYGMPASRTFRFERSLNIEWGRNCYEEERRDRNHSKKIDFNWKIKTDFHSNACRRCRCRSLCCVIWHPHRFAFAVLWLPAANLPPSHTRCAAHTKERLDGLRKGFRCFSQCFSLSHHNKENENRQKQRRENP